MSNIAVYYRLTKNEDINQVIQVINKEIQKYINKHVIKGVFIDDYRERSHLNELTNRPLQEIDILFVNRRIDDEFD